MDEQAEDRTSEEAFGRPMTFVPIDAAAKDGEVHLVRRGDDYAAARWTGDMWSEPGSSCAVQIDFDPEEYEPKTGRAA
jgi:hypothetical protein